MSWECRVKTYIGSLEPRHRKEQTVLRKHPRMATAYLGGHCRIKNLSIDRTSTATGKNSSGKVAQSWILHPLHCLCWKRHYWNCKCTTKVVQYIIHLRLPCHICTPHKNSEVEIQLNLLFSPLFKNMLLLHEARNTYWWYKTCNILLIMFVLLLPKHCSKLNLSPLPF